MKTHYKQYAVKCMLISLIFTILNSLIYFAHLIIWNSIPQFFGYHKTSALFNASNCLFGLGFGLFLLIVFSFTMFVSVFHYTCKLEKHISFEVFVIYIYLLETSFYFLSLVSILSVEKFNF